MSKEYISKSQIVYHDYINTKLHFNDFKYLGHNILNNNKLFLAYNKRKDKEQFNIISNYFTSRTSLINYFISGFLQNKKRYILDFIIDIDTIKEYHNKRIENSKNYISIFELDCIKIQNYIKTHDINIKELLRNNNQQPLIIRLVSDKKIKCSLETLSILDLFFGYTNGFKETQDFLWQEKALQIYKYKFWLNFKITKDYDEILKNTLLTSI